MSQAENGNYWYMNGRCLYLHFIVLFEMTIMKIEIYFIGFLEEEDKIETYYNNYNTFSSILQKLEKEREIS